MWTWTAIGCTSAAVYIGYLALSAWRASLRLESVVGRHVLITGGSEGIGFELAKLCCQRGAKVSLIARTASKLAAAIDRILKEVPGARVGTFAADAGDRGSLASAVQESEEKFGAVDICIAAAGSSTPKYFEELSDDDFWRMLRVNYMGVVNLAKEVLPRMTTRDAGHFCAVCSMAAAVPFVGYAAYAPAKAACRSFMDVLRNEFSDTKIQFHIAFPPDTDTPGFEVENKTKPYETSHVWPEMFNEVFAASQVAESLLDGVLRGNYFVQSPDVFGNLLVSRAWGHFPRTRPMIEALIAPIFVGLHEAMVWMADRGVRSRAHHAKATACSKPSESS
mmetsp:Transcript_12235/g.22983  ORF Transcript_12235/g.22983 Transcript_12235/m.22983 type:complete len:335 (+) Transcript_12235:46-1050(+)